MEIKIFNSNTVIDTIKWEMNEDFSELINLGKVSFSKTTAIEIMKIDNISVTSKILLSAVAGAVIQHIIDCFPSMLKEFERMYFIINDNF